MNYEGLWTGASEANSLAGGTMNSSNPPALPEAQPATRVTKQNVFLWVTLLFMVVAAAMGPLGLLRGFKVPTGGMSPTIEPGDHVFMEGISYLVRKPRRGDIAIFNTTPEIQRKGRPSLYIQRIAGEPGETVRISDGRLWVNGAPVALRNGEGDLHPSAGEGSVYLNTSTNEMVLSQESYLLLGDNSKNSFDSRYWGPLPGEQIKGRACFCYWPPARFGWVR